MAKRKPVHPASKHHLGPEWFENWIGHYSRYLEEHKKTHQVWTAVIKAGGAADQILWNLAIYTHHRRPGSAELDELRNQYGRYRAILDKAKLALKKTSKQLQAFRREPILTEVLNYVKETTGHDLDEVLSSYVAVFENQLLPFYARRSSLKGAQRVELYLVRLWIYLVRLTQRECYSDLAYLVEAAYAANEKNETVLPETIKKITERYMNSFPEHIAFWMDADLSSMLTERDLPFFAIPPIPPQE